MSDEIKKLVDDLNSAWAEFKNAHEQEQEEVKKLGQEAGETKQTIDRLQTAMDEVEVKLAKAIEIRDDPGSKDWRDRPEGKAFNEFLRTGFVSDEFKAQLQIGDDSAGGFLAPAEYIREIIKGVVEITPFRSVAKVRSVNATSAKVPKRTGVFAASWTASAGTRSETTGLTYGLEEIPTHELYARADVENQLVEDSVFDLSSELAMEFADQFGKAEGTAFVSGTGVGRPEGFLSHASLGTINTGTNDALGADDVINLYFEPKTEYAVNGTWLMNRGILKAVRKLKDSQNQYLWQPGLAGLAPATILDRPYIEAPDMAATVADAAKVIAFGDWQRAYCIVDRISMQVQRDPFTQAYSGATVFHARRRVGGQMVNSEAVKVLVVA